MRIRCPTCGFNTIFVVEVTFVATGETLHLPAKLAVFLEEEGFFIPLPSEIEDLSTIVEVAECQACGRRGSLADFGFGQQDAAKADDAVAGVQPKEVTLRLTLTVTYQTNGVAATALADLLETAALHAAEEGLLTGESPAEVLTWTADVAEIVNAWHA